MPINKWLKQRYTEMNYFTGFGAHNIKYIIALVTAEKTKYILYERISLETSPLLRPSI